MPSKKISPKKIGIMGGSFNPFHLGHLNSLLTVKEFFSLDKIIIVPTYSTPMSEDILDSKSRLDMLKLIAKEYPFIKIDDQEIKRKGISYTYSTIQTLRKKYPQDRMFFIMGLDQFNIFHLWKKSELILKNVSLIVTSRPQIKFSQMNLDLFKTLRLYIKKTQKKIWFGKPKYNNIYFCKLNDMDISSSLIRYRVNQDQNIKHLVPSTIENYIIKKTLYKKDLNIKKIKEACTERLLDKKAFDVQNFDLTKKTLGYSHALIASSSNTQHCKSLFRDLLHFLKKDFSLIPKRVEGESSGRWIVMDYENFVIHIFYEYIREQHELESIWSSSTT